MERLYHSSNKTAKIAKCLFSIKNSLPANRKEKHNNWDLRGQLNGLGVVGYFENLIQCKHPQRDLMTEFFFSQFHIFFDDTQEINLYFQLIVWLIYNII